MKSNEVTWVLHICNRLSVGGVQTFLMNYYKHIDRSRLQFAFAVQRDFAYDYDAEIESLGGKVHKLPPMEKNFSAYRKSLAQLIQEHPEYKIVHAHMNHRNALALLICKRLKVSVRISHSHNIVRSTGLVQKARVFMLKKILNKVATEFFACSPGAAHYLYGEKKKYHMLKNAISAANYSFSDVARGKSRKELQLSNQFVMCHIGNFSHQKNYPFLIKVLAEMPADTMLMLVGDGDLKDDVIQMASEMNVLERILFLGVRNDIEDILQAADVFVFPSLFEGLGIVAIEAQAAGLPTICSDAVPPEVDITDLIKHLPLHLPPSKWAEEINATRNTARKEQYDEICNSGYDIRENAEQLERFYLSKNTRETSI